MSRQKTKARGRTTLKNTRDGLVERNEATGEDTRLSKREADIDLRGDTTERETFSQVDNLKQPKNPVFARVFNIFVSYVCKTANSHRF